LSVGRSMLSHSQFMQCKQEREVARFRSA